MSVLKNIGAIIAGFLVVFILSVATDAILEKSGFFPAPGTAIMSNGQFILALVYRTVFTVLGGYVTASLSKEKPMRNVNILAVIGLIGSLLGIITTWGKNLGPEWYPIALFVLAYPSVWLGGKLKS